MTEHPEDLRALLLRERYGDPATLLRDEGHGTALGAWHLHRNRNRKLCEPCRQGERRLRQGYGTDEHGTHAAYVRHRKWCEDACRSCVRAETKYQDERRRVREAARRRTVTPAR